MAGSNEVSEIAPAANADVRAGNMLELWATVPGSSVAMIDITVINVALPAACTDNGRVITFGDPADFAKTVWNDRTGELLGSRLVGPEITELIQRFALARHAAATRGSGECDLRLPTLSHALQEAVLDQTAGRCESRQLESDVGSALSTATSGKPIHWRESC